MNQIRIARPTGFPVDNKTFEFMQEAYGSAISHLCQAQGDNLILHGVDTAGSVRTAGAVVINGELLPFVQSPNSATIEVVEEHEAVVFQGGEMLPTYFTRFARCSPNGTINIADLRRVRHTPTDWVNCTPTDGIQVIEPIQVRVNERGKAQLRGRYVFTNVDFARCFELPSNFIPAFDRIVPIYGTGIDGPFFQRIIIVSARAGWVGFPNFAGIEGSIVYNLDRVEFDL